MTRTHNSEWLSGPVVVAGNWEPLIYRQRLNALGTNGAALFRREHSRSAVREMKKAGVNLLITHYFKGFGLEGEREDMEATERFIPLCHEHGIRVGGYIGDTFSFETLLLEEPDAMEWCQRKADGSPLTYGGNLTYRLKWCRNNPAFLEYMKRVLERGISAGLDLLHFDNFLNKPEPKTCRCRHCAEKFRAFLYAKYSRQELKERLGFSDLTHVLPPTFTDPLYVCYGDDVIQNPLLQEWVDFRCQTLADSLRDLAAYSRSLNPRILIDTNPTGIWGENTASMRSVDHARLLPHGHFFWDESPNPHGLLPNGALPTLARSMKMGETLGNRVFFYCFAGNQYEADVKMGEALAFNNGCLGMVASLEGDKLPLSAMCRPFSRLLHDHPNLFCGTRSLARVAVYRNFSSLAFNAWEPHVQTLLAEQTLLQSRIPFDLVFGLATLRQRLLVIAGLECMSDEELRAINAYRRRGGHVILIGDVGQCDAWRRLRRVSPFDPVSDGENLIRVPALALPKSAPSKDERAVWDNFYKVVDGRFWGLPANADVLLDVLSEKRFRTLRVVETTAGLNTLIEPRRLAGGRGVVVHVINYDKDTLGRMEEIAIPARRAGRVERLIPGRRSEILTPERRRGRLCVSFMNDSVYSLLVIPDK